MERSVEAHVDTTTLYVIVDSSIMMSQKAELPRKSRRPVLKDMLPVGEAS